MNTIVPNEFEEENEFNEKTRIIGEQSYQTLKPTLSKIIETQTQMIFDGKTQRLGETKESTIIDEFWSYYSQFSSENLPSEEMYYGNEFAELKITILIRMFQDFYLERIYPISFPVPIIHTSYRSSKNKSKNPAKMFFVGDTHGSFFDTIKLIPFFVKEIHKGEEKGYEVKIVFIGDFVDRGKLDIHNLLYILTFNLKYQKNVLLLRGNHEEISINAHYGFGTRVMKHFSQLLFASFNHMFKDLPLIAIFHCNEGGIMCLHGGIPIVPNISTGGYEVPQLNTFQFNNRQVWIDEMDEVTQQILWNDPIRNYDPNSPQKYFKSRRGIGFVFNHEIFNEFCVKNHVNLLFRGHQVFLEGFHKHFDNRFITIFSATNYVKKKIDARFIELDSGDIYNFKVHRIQNLSS
ncbi:metallophosphoesterase [Promethearchaeum syntrophicum]|uniref:protein-serine/threonine phosphatase n=1 Tax=Promethearchaeum syntrophicum TaxID=2594042 RepID=A0A5B9D7S7_9ARCH|nr:metallophosphoesterase [Candidatus Prometheoarchaeum syntrophicum]QEE14937.1 Calcineurin-like phosphoesterase [Candidatus Prometheoarchaeum syntrophicum]